MCEIACLTQSLCVFQEYIFLYYKHIFGNVIYLPKNLRFICEKLKHNWMVNKMVESSMLHISSGQVISQRSSRIWKCTCIWSTISLSGPYSNNSSEMVLKRHKTRLVNHQLKGKVLSELDGRSDLCFLTNIIAVVRYIDYWRFKMTMVELKDHYIHIRLTWLQSLSTPRPDINICFGLKNEDIFERKLTAVNRSVYWAAPTE